MVLGLAAVLLAAALPALANASVPGPSYAETRVKGSNLEILAGVGAERGSSETGTGGYGESYDEQAVGYPLVPRGTTRLYRAVSQAELDDVAQFGFRPGPGAMETKLFATSAEDASFFGRDVLFPLDKRPLTILEVEVPESLASRLFRFTADGKPTVALDPALLQEFNAAARVRPLNYSPLPPP